MCKQCQESVDRHYPHLSQEDKYQLLMGATAFPFGGPEIIEGQLVELKEKTDGSLDGALAFADAELAAAMNAIDKEQPR